MPERIFTLTRSLTWGDCDPAGIVYYPNYHRWMDAATWDMLAACGHDAQRMREQSLTIPLVHAECDFFASPQFGDLLTVHSHVAKHGRSSFCVVHAFVRGNGPLLGELLARGREDRVWCRYQDGPGSPLRSTPLPSALLEAWNTPCP